MSIMDRLHTCRFCGNYEGEMVKYAVRHHAHPKCFLNAFGKEGFSKLREWQLRQFPYLVAKEMGLLPALEAAIKGA